MEDKKEKKEKVFISPKIEEYSKILEKNPSSLVFLNLADEYRKGKLFQEAIMVLEEGIKKNPNSVPALYLLGEIYFELTQLEKAKDCIEKLMKLKDDNVNAMKLLSKIYIINHWVSDAKDILLKAHGFQPDDREIVNMLYEIDPSIIQNDKKDNEEIKEDNIEEPPVSVGTITLAKLYFEQGFYNKSISILKKILKQDPMNQEAIALYEENMEKINPKTPDKMKQETDSHDKSGSSVKKRKSKLKAILENIKRRKKNPQ